MPMYDYQCTECKHKFEELKRIAESGASTCPVCLAPAGKIWVSKPPIAIGDECDIVQENGFPEPRRFTSKSERQRALVQLGLMERIQHTAVPGSDKSPHTTNWDAVSKETLEGAKAMLERVGSARGKTDEEIAQEIEDKVNDGELVVDSEIQVGNRRIGLRIANQFSTVLDVNVLKDYAK